MKKDATSFSAIAGYRSDIVDLTGRGEPVRITGMQTTAAFFDVFDAAPLLGRTYHEATDKPGAAVAVISEAIWTQQFGSESGGDRHAGAAQRHADGNHRRRPGIPAASAEERRVDAVAARRADIAVRHRRDKDGIRGVHYFSAIGRVAANRKSAMRKGS